MVAGRRGASMVDACPTAPSSRSSSSLWSSGYVVGALAIGVADPIPLLAIRFTLAALGGRPARAAPRPLARRAARPPRCRRRPAAGRPVRRRSTAASRSACRRRCRPSSMLGLSPLVTTGLAVGSGQERGDARLWAGLAVGVLGVAISLAPELGSAQVGVGVAVTVLGDARARERDRPAEALGGGGRSARVRRGADSDRRAHRRPGRRRLRRARRRVGAARAVLGLVGLGHGHRQPAGHGQHLCAATPRARSRRCCSPSPRSPRSGRPPSSARRCIPPSLLGMLVAMAGIGAVLGREAAPRAGFRSDVGSPLQAVCGSDSSLSKGTA